MMLILKSISGRLILLSYSLVPAIPFACACSYAQSVPISVPPSRSSNITPQVKQSIQNANSPASSDNLTGDEKNWIKLITFTGKENATTPAFYISSQKWRFRWSLNSAMSEYASFHIFIINESTGYIAGSFSYSPGSILNGQLTVTDNPDNFHIKIIVANLEKWKVAIEYDDLSVPGSPVQISLIHYQGNLAHLGCCSSGLFEADEYVAITNFGKMPQDIRGWTLKNITKGYPSFTFPDIYHCIPFIPFVDTEHTTQVPRYNAYEPKSVINQFTTAEEALRAAQLVVNEVEIDWTQCSPLQPLDERPMEPKNREQGIPVPCILYPGQTVLVFTDKIHCIYGGLSFNYGGGNIWDNYKPDTAVLL